MPIYNCQERFVPMILDGSKPHTIRRRRKYPTKVGDILYLYIGLRTKKAFKFAEVQCVKIEPARFYLDRSEMYIWSPEQPGDLYYREGEEIGSFRLLLPEEVNEISKQDGFEDVYDFFDFFKRYRSDYLDDFEIIWWDPAPFRQMICSLGFDMRG